MLENLLKKKSESSILRAVKIELIDSGKFPPKFLENLKYIAKTKKDTEKDQSQISQILNMCQHLNFSQ